MLEVVTTKTPKETVKAKLVYNEGGNCEIYFKDIKQALAWMRGFIQDKPKCTVSLFKEKEMVLSWHQPSF